MIMTLSLLAGSVLVGCAQAQGGSAADLALNASQRAGDGETASGATDENSSAEAGTSGIEATIIDPAEDRIVVEGTRTEVDRVVCRDSVRRPDTRLTYRRCMLASQWQIEGRRARHAVGDMTGVRRTW